MHLYCGASNSVANQIADGNDEARGFAYVRRIEQIFEYVVANLNLKFKICQSVCVYYNLWQSRLRVWPCTSQRSVCTSTNVNIEIEQI